MIVERNNTIAITTLSDWFKNLAPVFQPIKTKTNRTLYAQFFFTCIDQVTVNYQEFLLSHRVVCSCCDWSQ